MRLIVALLVFASVLSCLVAASQPRYSVVRRSLATRRRHRRRDCANSGPNQPIGDNISSSSSSSANGDAEQSSSSSGPGFDSSYSSSDDPVSSASDTASISNGGNNNGLDIAESTGEISNETSSVDSNSIISPEDKGFTNGNGNATVVDNIDPSQADPKDSGVTFQGTIDQYQVGNDACLSKSTENDLVAALNPTQYEELVDSDGNPVRCYECVLIHGDKGDVEVTIVDECPDCKVDELKLSAAAFASVTSKTGQTEVTWEFSVCSANSFSKTRPDKNGAGSSSSD